MKQGNSLGDGPVRKDTYRQEKRTIVHSGGEKSQNNLICGNIKEKNQKGREGNRVTEDVPT